MNLLHMFLLSVDGAKICSSVTILVVHSLTSFDKGRHRHAASVQEEFTQRPFLATLLPRKILMDILGVREIPYLFMCYSTTNIFPKPNTSTIVTQQTHTAAVIHWHHVFSVLHP